MRWLATRRRRPFLATALTALSLVVAACGDSSAGDPDAADDLAKVSPALERYRDDLVDTELWNRPGLSGRDRSVVTLAALVANGQEAELPKQLERALANGVAPAEISELITHLAFYAGWPNAEVAAGAARDVFAQRDIGSDQLPAASPELLPLDEAAEEERRATNEQTYGAITPGVLEYTTDVLFRELWLRPGLTPRDRSLVTVSALVATGQVAQVTYHLGRAMDNGLTREQASEALTQLAFYTGWPKVFSALPVVKAVVEARAA